MRFAEKPRKVPVVIADDMATGRGGWIDVSKSVILEEMKSKPAKIAPPPPFPVK